MRGIHTGTAQHRPGDAAGRRTSRLRTSLLAGCALAAAAGGANAAAADDAESADDDDRIVVTGTRIQRSGFTTPSPVTVTTREEIDDLGIVNVGDVLANLPMSNPEVSATQTTAGSLNGYVNDANIGAELANLRGLNLAFGTRTLTLVDGHRFVPSTNGGAVDLALIPSNLVLRTEVVTGGASAAYGSDAVAGVVNVVLNSELEGIQGQIDFAETFVGDGEEKHVGLAGGRSLFNGRGHIVGGVEWTDSGGVGQCSATRDWCDPYAIFEEEEVAERANGTQFVFVNDARGTATPNGAIIDLADPSDPPGPAGPFSGGVDVYEDMPAFFLNKQFNDSGTALVDWQAGDFINNAARLMAGGEGVPADDQVLLRVPVEREAFYSRFQYDLTNAITGFAELSYGRRKAENSQATLGNSLIGSSTLTGLLIKDDNAFLPADVAAGLAATTIPGSSITPVGIWVNKPISSLPEGRRPFSTADNKTYRFVGGLEGGFDTGFLGERNWEWDAYYTYGKNEQEQRLQNLARRNLNTNVVDGIDSNGFEFGLTGGAFEDGSYPDVQNDPLGIYGVSNWDLATDAVVDSSDGQIKCRVNSAEDRTAVQQALLFTPIGDLPTGGPPGTITQQQAQFARDAGIPELVAGCMPLNTLGLGVGQGQSPAEVMAALDWVLGTQVEDYEYTQHVFGGNAQGEVFDIWTGPVIVAAGFEYRDEEGETFHTAPVQYWNPDYGSGFAGEQQIIEGYLETDFSLLRDQPFARDLAINAAVRRTKVEAHDNTDISITGIRDAEFEFTTWKVSGVWDINDHLRFRATQSKDIRAPSFRELFFPGRPTIDFATAPVGPVLLGNPWLTAAVGDDPAALPSSGWQRDPGGGDLPRNGGGNPELLPEEADTTTLGVVIQPGGALDGLRVSIDGYQIELSNGIANVYTNGIINSCYFLDDPNACARIVLETPTDLSIKDNPDVDYDAIVTGSNNTSTFTVKGVDFEVVYDFELDRLVSGWGGEISLRALTTYMDQLLVEGDNRGTLFGVQQLLTFASTDYAGQLGAGGVDDIASFSESPHWQGTYSGTYANGPFRTTLQARYVGDGTLYNDLIGIDDADFALGARNTINVPNEVGSYLNWTWSGSYNFGADADGGRDIEVFGVINNLFDREPEIAPPLTTGVGNSGGGSSVTNPVFYDLLGRRYRIGVRFRF